jgi:hypothetical protein
MEHLGGPAACIFPELCALFRILQESQDCGRKHSWIFPLHDPSLDSVADEFRDSTRT